ncbi:MAG: hypothetical protein J7599_18080 [Niabella sp.]|nr:hypothetical protein [Niabella sp.]
MVVVIETYFMEHLVRCPLDFQLKFRKIYQQLKVAEDPLEIQGIRFYKKGKYKIFIDNSRIAMKVKGDTATIGQFLHNEFYSFED